MRRLDGITDTMDMSLHKLWELVMNMSLSKHESELVIACCSPWGCKESDATERLSTHTDNVTG